ncbi:MAG: hypothetical protein QF389_10325, partial [Planctomycetota bacterium]|nr:hypothetical protein [Planctomycetota bacterium]
MSSEAAGVARWFQKWLWQHAGDAHVCQMPDHTHIIMLSVDDMITPFFSFHLSPTLSPFSLSLSLSHSLTLFRSQFPHTHHVRPWGMGNRHGSLTSVSLIRSV